MHIQNQSDEIFKRTWVYIHYIFPIFKNFVSTIKTQNAYNLNTKTRWMSTAKTSPS